MFKTKMLARNLVMAGAATLLLGSSAFAQYGSSPRTGAYGNRGFANRVVEGTVSSVVHERNGDRVRLTSGMDLFVPNSIYSMNQGRRFGASMLQSGDVVRMNVWSREGDGRDAQVRSIELLQSASFYGNDRRLSGTVISFDRRARSLVLQAENGRTITVDVRSYGGRGLRNGDRISISGRMSRGILIADDIRVSNTGQNDQYGHRR